MKSTTAPIMVAACAILLLLPVWLPPHLATTDGPSHVYNAVVGADLREGGATYGAWLEQGTTLAPNRAANTVLTSLVPAVGASLVEKLLFGFTLLGTFLLLVALSSRDARPSMAGILACAWLAQHWFAWTGFFDFSLSTLAFAALLLVLQQPAGPRRDVLIQLVALFLAWSHLFTFAVGVALITWVLLVSGLRERRPLRILPALPPALLLAGLIAAGGTGGGGFGWGHPGKALAGLAIGDFVTTFHPADLAAGVIIMIVFWTTLFRSLAAVRSLRLGALPALPVFAAALALMSVIGPDAVGEGSYISARLRFLAVLSLLPLIGPKLASLGPTTRRVLNVALLAALVFHSAFAAQRGRVISRDAADIDSLIAAARARPGDAIQISLADHERGAFRISAYAHLHARTAVHRRLIVLDNYEARLHVFPTRWLREPEALRIERRGPAIQLLRRNGAPWQRPIHLVHEAGMRVETLDPAIRIHQTAQGTSFAVTSVSFEPGRDTAHVAWTQHGTPGTPATTSRPTY